MKEFVRAIREKHNEINKSMDHFLIEESKQMHVSFSGLEPPLEKLKKAGVPQLIIDHLQHKSLEKLRRDSEERKIITTKINQSFDKLEANPEANKQEIINILQLFKKAENNIIASHDLIQGEQVYQSVFDITATASAAIDMLKSKGKLAETPLLMKRSMK